MIGNISATAKALLHSAALILTFHFSLANGQTGRPSEAKTMESASPSSFEVVTIKPSNRAAGNSSWGVSDDIYRATNLELLQIIGQAYIQKSGYSPAERIKGGPQGILNERYDIVAKLDESTARRIAHLRLDEQMDAITPMLRTMLEERFHLKVTPSTMQARAYALLPGKHGPKLKLAPEDGSFPPEIEKRIAAYPYLMRKLPNGGQVSMQVPGEALRPLFFQVTMDELTSFLGMTGATVVNRTGLNGRYSFYLSRVAGASASDGGDPSFESDSEDRLYAWQLSEIGLEIKPVTVTVPAVEIEHVERATAN